MMKTAISLPDNLFFIAEKYAKKHGLSIDDVYTAAVREFFEKQKVKQQEDITRKINDICDKLDTSPNPQIKAAGRRILLDAEW